VITQSQVHTWCRLLFGESTLDAKTRSIRCLEEAIELAQAEGVNKDVVLRWVEHVFSKPIGDPLQEGAGVGFTLMAWAASRNVDLQYLISAEFARVSQPHIMEIIKEKQKGKE
jgi:hypothetical protein